jgi:transcriptional regulator with XRE-family HTH domain
MSTTTEKSKSCKKSEQTEAVPIPSPGIGTRIKAVADILGSRAEAAEAAGVSEDMLFRYMREESKPAFAALAGLCAKAGVSLDWMATGKGPMRREAQEQAAEAQGGELNIPHLVDAIEVVEMGLSAAHKEMPAPAKATIVALLYRTMEMPKEPQEKFIKIVQKYLAQAYQ